MEGRAFYYKESSKRLKERYLLLDVSKSPCIQIYDTKGHRDANNESDTIPLTRDTIVTPQGKKMGKRHCFQILNPGDSSGASVQLKTSSKTPRTPRAEEEQIGRSFAVWALSELQVTQWIDAIEAQVLRLQVLEMLEMCELGGDLNQTKSYAYQVSAYLNQYGTDDSSIAERLAEISNQISSSSRNVSVAQADPLGDAIMVPGILPKDREARISVLLNTQHEARGAISSLRGRLEAGPLINKYLVGVMGTQEAVSLVADLVSSRYSVPTLMYEEEQTPPWEHVVDHVLEHRSHAVVLLASHELLSAGLRPLCNALWCVGENHPMRHWCSAVLPSDERLLMSRLSSLWDSSVPVDPSRPKVWDLVALHPDELDAPLIVGVEAFAGRSKDNLIRCSAEGVSRIMCSLSYSPDDLGWLLSDKSRNGTYVCNEKVGPGSTRLLKHGDLLQLAKSSIKSGSLLGQFVLVQK